MTKQEEALENLLSGIFACQKVLVMTGLVSQEELQEHAGEYKKIYDRLGEHKDTELYLKELNDWIYNRPLKLNG